MKQCDIFNISKLYGNVIMSLQTEALLQHGSQAERSALFPAEPARAQPSPTFPHGVWLTGAPPSHPTLIRFSFLCFLSDSATGMEFALKIIDKAKCSGKVGEVTPGTWRKPRAPQVPDIVD